MPYLENNLGDISFDPKVQSYCVNPSFKCPNYGHSWACPPEAPYLEEEVSKYQRFVLVYFKFNLSEYIQDVKAKHPKRSEKNIRNTFFMNNLIRDKLEQEINNFFEEDQILYKKKLVLWDGFCRICYNNKDKGCNYDSGDPCRYPDKKRYSMEAVGIDVGETVKNVDIEIEWPPINFAYRFGLICLK